MSKARYENLQMMGFALVRRALFASSIQSVWHAAPVEALSDEEIRKVVRAALDEDIGSGDVTTLATVTESATARAVMVAREPLVLAGVAFAEAAFRERSRSTESRPTTNASSSEPRPATNSELQIERLTQDADQLSKGAHILRISGPAQAILTAERVALNFVQRLSGIATLTAQFVEAVQGTQAQILDTRKTMPGWRRFEKYAVTCGGGHNHRFGLFDMVLIKDNHLAVLRHELPSPIEAAVRRARERYPQLKIEVEADTPEQVHQALFAGADIILLDNMSLDEMRTAVGWIGGKAKTEASGGVNLSTVRAIAETGVDYISVGALTHSARAVDIALDFEALT